MAWPARYCCHCKQPIDQGRIRRGSFFCSRECHMADRLARRRALAEVECRRCGRRLKAPKPPAALTPAANLPVATVAEAQCAPAIAEGGSNVP